MAVTKPLILFNYQAFWLCTAKGARKNDYFVVGSDRRAVFGVFPSCIVVLEVPAATQGVWEAGSSGVRVSTYVLI